MNAVGVLNENLKSAIFKNLKELSTIEGNIASFATINNLLRLYLLPVALLWKEKLYRQLAWRSHYLLRPMLK